MNISSYHKNFLDTKLVCFSKTHTHTHKRNLLKVEYLCNWSHLQLKFVLLDKNRLQLPMVAADTYNHRVYRSWQKLLKTKKKKRNTQFNHNETIICETIIFLILIFLAKSV